MASFSNMNAEKVCEVVENAILDAFGQNLKSKLLELAEQEIDEVVRETMKKLNVRSAFMQEMMGPSFRIDARYNGEKVEQEK
jgi:hypothetical protein